MFGKKSYIPNDKTREAVARATINNDRIRVAVSDVSLATKIKTNIQDINDNLFWYIKFNIVLDPSSISKKSMNVMETNGYILNTEITYNSEKNLIVINPVDKYAEGIFYILNIKKKVRSANGNHMKKNVHILFKIKDGKILPDYKILPPNVKVAKPRKKPKHLKTQTISRVYMFDDRQQAKYDKLPKDMLPYDDFKTNFIFALIGIVLAVIGVLSDVLPIVMVGGGVILIGIIHLFIQISNKKRASILQYNLGVMFFNKRFYKPALKRFVKAVQLDENNEMAEYAVNKVSFYL